MPERKKENFETSADYTDEQLLTETEKALCAQDGAGQMTGTEKYTGPPNSVETFMGRLFAPIATSIEVQKLRETGDIPRNRHRY